MTENKETVEQQLLDKACRKATSDGIQQVMLALQDGKLVLSGAQNYVPPLVDDSDLFRKVENLMNQATLDENDDLFYATNKIPKYALLPCSPYTSEWKGSANLRSILREMLAVAGYKASGRKKTLGITKHQT